MYKDVVLNVRIGNSGRTFNLKTFTLSFLNFPGLESNPTNNSSEIVIGANNIYFHGNEDGAGNINQTDIFIDGDLQYSNGNQQNGYILQSDANGNADWVDPSTINPVINDWTLNGTHMYNANTGNIGIGTTSPNSKLNIVTSAGSPLLLLEGSGLTGGGLHFTYKNTTEGYEIRGDDQGGINLEASGNHKISFETSSNERMRITGNGNVGIGTSSPSKKLHIYSTSNSQARIESVNGLANLEIDGGVNKAAVDFYDNGNWSGTMGYSISGNYLFWTESGQTTLVSKGGNIGIGTTSPSSKIDISSNGNSSSTNSMTITNTAGTDLFNVRDDGLVSVNTTSQIGQANFVVNDNDNSGFGGISANVNSSSGKPFYSYAINGTPVAYSYLDGADGSKLKWYNGGVNMTLTNSGDLGIGTTNPAEKLDVEGNIEVNGDYKYEAAKTRYMSFNGIGFTPVFETGKLVPLNVGSSMYYYFADGSGLRYAAQRLDLPDGAIITNLDGWLYDNDNSALGRVRICRQQNGNSSDAILATVETTGSGVSTFVQSLSQSLNHTVDNQNYSYYIWVEGYGGNTNIRYYGAKITYTVLKAN